MQEFKQGARPILVATDVAALGKELRKESGDADVKHLEKMQDDKGMLACLFDVKQMHRHVRVPGGQSERRERGLELVDCDRQRGSQELHPGTSAGLV